MNKTIEITVSPTGETKVETKGFTGGECRDASQFVEGPRAADRRADDRRVLPGQQVNQDLRQSS